MAKERMKGATWTDKAAHQVYEAGQLRRPLEAYCMRCGRILETAYHEEMLYSVQCPACETVTLVKARSYYDAAEKVGIVARPAKDVRNRCAEGTK